MVKLADVKKDLEKLSDFTKTPMFNYNDIHSENVKNSCHYDYEKIISDVCRIKNNAEQKNNRFALARKKLAKTIDKTFSPEKAFGISVEEVKIPKQIKNMELLIAKNIQKIK